MFFSRETTRRKITRQVRKSISISSVDSAQSMCPEIFQILQEACDARWPYDMHDGLERTC